MRYEVSSSAADTRGEQLCKLFPDPGLKCGAGCDRPLPPLHIHLWFESATFATGVCSEACAAIAIRRRQAA